MSAGSRRIFPGFNLSLGYTLVYLSLIVLIPLAAVAIKAGSLGFEAFWDAVSAPNWCVTALSENVSSMRW